MKKFLFLTVLCGTTIAAIAHADGPAAPVSAAPTVAIASAKEADGKVTIKLRVVESIPVAEKRTVTVFETVAVNVGGQVVNKQVPVQKTVDYTVMRMVWKELSLPADGPGTKIRDLEGKEVPAKKVKELLEKETPVLFSTVDAVDPLFLKIAKEGTLVITTTPVGGVGGAPAPVPVPAVPKAIPVPIKD
jgi:hypothetical protein